MENENNTEQDCGCGTDCCTPKKNNLWMKIVFIAIVLAAAAIVTIKLTGNSGVNENQVTTPTEKSCCGGDTTKKCSGDTTKVCDPQKESSCCPGNKK